MTYKPPRSSNEDRTARQAEALRANLKRRKAAARKEPAPADAPLSHHTATMGRPAQSSGITAMASISTSHSGRARADTTMPVETGNTPFNQRPTTRYTASR